MDIDRLFIILSISLIFITLFCDDYLIEGAVGDNDRLVLDSNVDQTTSGDGQQSEVDVTLTGEKSSDVKSTSVMNSINSKNQDLTIDVKKKDQVSKDGGEDNKIFGMDCVKNCTDYYHSCEAKTEYKRDHRGKKRPNTTYGHIEECPNGQLPEKSCDDGWFCKKCDDGYYPMNGVCKKRPNMGIIISVIVLIGLLGILFVLGREYIFAAIRGAGDKRGRGTMDIRVVDGK